MRKLVVIAVLLSNWAYGQDLIVLDASSAEPLSRVSISDLSGEKGTHTNKLGQAWLKGFTAQDTLVLSTIGHHDKLVFPFERTDALSTLFMQPQVTQLDHATIFGEDQIDDRKTIPQVIKTIRASEIRLQQPNTAADMLMSSGNVIVQKSQLGGGSPIIRGFEANKILLVLDGVRLNNAIYRSGHVQNAITIDPMVIETTDIFYGPGAVMFGSDALGGTIHFKTRDPILKGEKSDELLTSVNLRGTLGSAAQSKSGHIDFMISGAKFGSLTSVTHQDFGDLRMGSWRPHGDENWGKVFSYADREENSDVARENGNPGIQRGTGYHQTDFLQKFLFKPSESWEYLLNLQYSTSSDIPRFDRLNDLSDGELKWAEWYYGPQNRFFASATANHTLVDKKWADRIQIIGSYQRIDEDRVERRFGRVERSIQEEDVHVYGVNLNISKRLFHVEEKKQQSAPAKPSHTLNYGLEGLANTVSSTARLVDITTQESSSTITRYPNGGSDTWSGGVYTSLRSKWSEKVATSAGARYSYAGYASTFLPDGSIQLPFEEINRTTGALTGNLGLVWTPDSIWNITSGLSTGFRNPNVDDYGKVFEKDGFVVVPNDQLKAEKIANAELKISRLFSQNRVRITALGYFSYLQDAIVRRNFSLNGDTLLSYNGDLARIQTNINASEAIVYGVSAELSAELRRDLSAKASFHYTYGQDITSETPLAHIPPYFGKAGLSYYVAGFRGEIYGLYNGAKTVDRFSPGSTDNPIEGLETGYPSWWTLNIKTSFRISNTFTTDFSLENILDRHYKVFASGLSSPGVDAKLTLRVHLD